MAVKCIHCLIINAALDRLGADFHQWKQDDLHQVNREIMQAFGILVASGQHTPNARRESIEYAIGELKAAAMGVGRPVCDVVTFYRPSRDVGNA